MFKKERRMLVVAAHPDDEVLGCGGTIRRAVEAGMEVMVQFLGEGISARFPFGQYDSDDFRAQTAVRMAGSKRALEVLGVNRFAFGERLCGQFDKYPLISIVKDIEQVLQDFAPDLLFTHNLSEVNIDHKIAYEAVEVACRPTRTFVPSEIYSFEIPCSGSWTFDTSFRPNVFVDVTDQWEKKMEAWVCYEGESRPFPFPRSHEGLRTLAQYRGMMSNLKLAEAFRLARRVVS